MDFFKEYGSFIDKKKIPDTNEYNIASLLSGEHVISPYEYAYLLSEQVEPSLEYMARSAHVLTVQYFGKVVQLYTPLYLSNFCINKCIYCNFNSSRDIVRTKLNSDEIEKEARLISEQGFKHILILTGEDRVNSSLDYIKNAVQVLKKYFSSISIEIYPLEEDEYKELVDLGVDGLTVYQEVYDRDIYDKIHPAGPKKDYFFRLNTPERAARAGIRTISIGSLLGLNDFRYEFFITGIHAKYLQDKYPSCEISVSVPRLRPYGGMNYPAVTVTDKNLVQMISAFRNFLPRVGIVLSTRESNDLRNNLLPLGITKMSAGSNTEVGGRTKETDSGVNDGQFDISDTRDLLEIKSMLVEKGYQPVHQDWITV